MRGDAVPIGPVCTGSKGDDKPPQELHEGGDCRAAEAGRKAQLRDQRQARANHHVADRTRPGLARQGGGALPQGRFVHCVRVTRVRQRTHAPRMTIAVTDQCPLSSAMRYDRSWPN